MSDPNDEIERQTTANATAAADFPLLLYRGSAGGSSIGIVLNQLAETAEHIAEFTREFGDQDWSGMNESEAAGWRELLAELEAAAATFRHTIDLIG